jgi:photosystem II stability/assembly factor-like uncharacterized protein
MKGIAAGTGGLFTTLDGGDTWTKKLENMILSIAFSNAHTAWAAGPSGLFKSIDIGLEWSPVPMKKGSELTSVYFFDEMHGWVAGSENTLFRTEDGGVTWSALHAPSFFPTCIQFISPQVGWILGDVGEPVEKTTDGGVTWIEQVLGDTDVVFMDSRSISFVDKTTGFVSRSGYSKNGDGILNDLFKTIDAGQSWFRLPSKSQLKSLQFLDASRGSAIIAGIDGRDSLAFTSDGGRTWIAQAQPERAWNRIFALNDTLSFAVGENGAMVKSTDGGADWTPTPKGITANLLTAFAIDSMKAFVGGWYGVLGSTIDGGKTWKQTKLSDGASIISLGFLDGNTGWAVDFLGSISKTLDGGQTWQTRTSGITDYLNYVTATSGNVLYALDSNNPSKVFKTTIGGGDWTLVATLPAFIQSISFPDSANGWAVAFSGEVFHTRDGGKSWQPQATGVTAAILSVQFLDSMVGWASGNNQLLSTQDGGATWSAKSLPETNLQLFFTDKNHGWIWNPGGLLYRTRDGGDIWRKIEKNEAPVMIMGMHYADSLHGWRVGENGLIQKTGDGGGEGTPITFSSFLKGASFFRMPVHLSDNGLSYTLQFPGRVDASVYNLDGKLIRRVLSGRQNAGRHFLDLSTLNAPAGLYFLDFRSPSGRQSIQFRHGL